MSVWLPCDNGAAPLLNVCFRGTEGTRLTADMGAKQPSREQVACVRHPLKMAFPKGLTFGGS
jgi:hypothetical protein